jgi:hypothetical protein
MAGGIEQPLVDKPGSSWTELLGGTPHSVCHGAGCVRAWAEFCHVAQVLQLEFAGALGANTEEALIEFFLDEWSSGVR